MPDRKLCQAFFYPLLFRSIVLVRQLLNKTYEDKDSFDFMVKAACLLAHPPALPHTIAIPRLIPI